MNRVRVSRATLRPLLLCGLVTAILGNVAYDAPALASSAVQPASAVTRGGLADAEYAAAPAAAGSYRVINRAQYLSALFSETGARLIVAGEGDSLPGCSLIVTGYGYEGRVRVVGPPALTAEGNRVTFSYPTLTEWYANGPGGLEHGFVLPAPPGEAAAGDGSQLYVDSTLSGPTYAKVAPPGNEIYLFAPADDAALRLSDLTASDASGALLDGRFEVLVDPISGEPAGLRIVVSGRAIAFPVTVRTVLSSMGDHSDLEAEARKASGLPAVSDVADAAGSTPSDEGRTLAPPPNDTCGGAEVIPSAGPGPYLSAVTADITDATTTGDLSPPPGCPIGAASPSRSIWYTFTPSSTGTHVVSICADAPTVTTVDDTILGVFTSSTGTCGGVFTSVVCDDDACTTEGLQSVVSTSLTAGTTYFLQVWKWDNVAPTVGNTAVQVRITRPAAPPANDNCSAPADVFLDTPLVGTNAGAINDYQLSGAACFTGIGQTASTAVGRDTVHRFTAPAADTYSFKTQSLVLSGNPVLHVASTCPAAPPPVTLATCLGASNRNTTTSALSAAEEVFCLPLVAGQVVYVYVDEAAASIAGGQYRLEVNRCRRENEPPAASNDTPATAIAPLCGIEGSITPAAEADFYLLGNFPPDSRVFAMADGVAGSSNDFTMRVTTVADTLQYADDSLDAGFGQLSPSAGGTKTVPGDTYLRMAMFSAAVQSEPYRLYAVVQRPGFQVPESEPNNNVIQAQSNGAAVNYFAGDLPGPSPSTDVDLYPFTAVPGDLIIAGLDSDPEYDATSVNAALALLNSSGTVLVAVDDTSGTFDAPTTRPVSPGLTSTIPHSPSEHFTFRVTQAGTYYVRVMPGVSAALPRAGTYLLSIAKNCLTGGGGIAADLSITKTDDVDPVQAGEILTYTVTVTNPGTADAVNVKVTDTLPAGVTLLNTTGCAEDPAGVPTCTLGTIGPGASKQYTIRVRVDGCTPHGTVLTNTAQVTSPTPDPDPTNNSVSETTTVVTDGFDRFGSTGKVIVHLDPAFFPIPPSSPPVVIRLSSAGLLDSVVRRGPMGPNIPIELVSLSLTGATPLAGNVQVSQSPFFLSLGSIDNVVQDAQCRLISGDSRLGVYVRIDLPNFGVSLFNDGPNPIDLRAHLDHLPPYDDQYENPFLVPIPLYDVAFPPPNPPRARLLYEVHHADPEFPPGEIDCFDTTMTAQAQLFPPFPFPGNFLLQASGETDIRRSDPFPPSPPVPPDPLGSQIQTELVSMDLRGFDPGLGGNYFIRQNTAPPQGGFSLGSISENPDAPDRYTYAADSFFDVFFRIDTAAGPIFNRPGNPAQMIASDGFAGNGLRIVPPGTNQFYQQSPAPVQLEDQFGNPIGFIQNINHTIRDYMSWQPPPPRGRDCFDSWITLEITLNPPVVPFACSETLMLPGPVKMLRGDPFDPGDGRDVIDTIFACGILRGPSACLGGTNVTVHPSRTLTSSGRIQSIAPSENFPADSFFDVFMEMETVAGQFHTNASTHMTTTINAVPPGPGEIYYGPGTVIPLFDSANNLIGSIKEISHEIHSSIICPCECEPRIFIRPNKTTVDVGIDPGGAGVQYDVASGTNTDPSLWLASFAGAACPSPNGPRTINDASIPATGQLIWYASREGAFSVYNGTYNSCPSTTQVGDRDVEIAPVCP